MSYCQFENTSIDMRQLLFSMASAIEKGEPLDLSDTEERAYATLLDQCHDFINMHEEIVNL